MVLGASDEGGRVFHSMEEFDFLKKEFVTAARAEGYMAALAWRTVGSTNDEAKRMFGSAFYPSDSESDSESGSRRDEVHKGFFSFFADEGCTPDSAVFWAFEQSAGRGRLGRNWVSSAGVGICMSFAVPAEGNMSAITIAAGVSLCMALRKCGYDARLKWPNDILIDGKKVCGILSERIGNEAGEDYVVVGAGLNSACTFTGELAETAVSLKDARKREIGKKSEISPSADAPKSDTDFFCSAEITPDCKEEGIVENSDLYSADSDFPDESVRAYVFGTSRRDDLLYGMKLMVGSIGRTVRNFRKINLSVIMDLARAYCVTINSRVEVHNVHDREGYFGIARDIDADGALIVELPGGERRRVFAGEVTLKKGG